jgi:hypothetical protein
VLVLDTSQEPIPPVKFSDFRITLNAGRPFRPTHVRREDDDPITLAVLIDLNANQRLLRDRLSAAMSQIAPDSLRPHDRVLLYSFGCGKLYRSPQSANDAAGLVASVDAALTAIPRPASRSVFSREKVRCGGTGQLLSAMARTAQLLGTQPGRRVLLAMTDGYPDNEPASIWRDLKTYAVNQSVTIFALSQPIADMDGAPGQEDLLSNLCQLTGGILMRSSAKKLPQRLALLIRMLRERYIIEFPRPADVKAGSILIDVTLGHKIAFIRPSGAGVPLPTPDETRNPAAPVPDPEITPELGGRRILDP